MSRLGPGSDIHQAELPPREEDRRPAPVTFYLARHGETEWNVEGRMQGRRDSPLTPLGVEQAQRIGSALRDVPLDAALASPSPRAVRTAEIAVGGRALPVALEPALQEISLGAWEGRLIEDILSEFPDACRAYRCEPEAYRSPTGGETFPEVRARVLHFWRGLTRTPPGAHVLVATHTIPLKILLAELDGRPLARLWDPPSVAPGAVFELRFDGVGVRVTGPEDRPAESAERRADPPALRDVLRALGGVLAGRLVTLRPARRADLPYIRSLWTDPRTMAPVGGPLEVTDERLERWYAGMVDPGRDSELYLLITASGDGRPLGEASLHGFDQQRGTAHLNVKVAAQERGRGYGRDALAALLDFFFTRARGAAVLDDVDLENGVGQALLRSCGFTRDPAAQDLCRMRLSREAWFAARRSRA